MGDLIQLVAPVPDDEDIPGTRVQDRVFRGLAIAMVAFGLAVAGWQWTRGPVERVDRALATLPIQLLGASGPGGVLTSGAPTVLHLWMPGCGACAAEAPTIEAARRAFDGRVRFVSVSVNADQALTARAAKSMGLQGQLGVTTGNLLEALDLSEVPSTAWITADGRLVTLAHGALSPRILARETEALLR